VTPAVEVVSVAVAPVTALLAARQGLVRVTVSLTASPGSIVPLLLLALSSTATSVAGLTTSRKGTLNDSCTPRWAAVKPNRTL